MPLYYTLAYFGSGYLVLSFARRVSQVFQAVFSALFSSSPVSVSLQPPAGFPSASRPVQFAPTWWDPSHCFGKRRKKKKRVYCRMCIRKGRPLRGKVPNRKNLRCQCSSQGPALRQNGEIYCNPDANSGLHLPLGMPLLSR